MARKTSTRPEPHWDEIIKSVRPGRRRRVSAGRHRGLLFVFLILVSLGLALSGVYVYLQLKLKANAIDIEALSSQKADEPVNVLVIGSDARDVLPEKEQELFDPTGRDRGTGRRADTIILIHLDEQRDQAVLIHFPRDLRVRNENGRFGKINGLYQQGPGALIDGVEAFSGLPVHHYVEVNFVGFRNIVKALGGVDVYFERAIREPDSGIDVPAGCVTLEGDQALAFVRLRKIDSDFGRIARQQLFISLMMDKITSAGTVVNIPKLLRLVNLFSDNVTTDASLSLTDVRKMAFRLRSFDPKRVDMRVVPSSGARIGGVSYVVPNEKQTEALFTALAGRQPLPDYGRTGVSPIDPADVRVAVLNGTTVNGLAARAAEEIAAKGYVVAGKPTNADRSDYSRTMVFFKEGNEDKARLVAGSYGAEVKALSRGIAVEGEVVLVVGRDYAEGKATPPPPAPGGGDGAKKPLIHRCGE